jgi:hypothetical protein
MGASFFTVLSPAKFGRLWTYCVREVALGFWKCTSVHFLPLIGAFDALKVIEVFPDVVTLQINSINSDLNCVHGSHTRDEQQVGPPLWKPFSRC